MRAVTPPNTIETSRPTRKPSVRFSQVVHIAPYERATPAEARNIWFSAAEIGSFKQHARIMATVYRHYGGVPQPTEDDSGDLRTLYRGFENCTPTRQRRRLLSNRSVVYAHRNGMSDDFVAAMYKQCNKWSGEVAFVQAVHDYIDIFYSSNSGSNSSSNSMENISGDNKSKCDRAALAAMMIPSVTSMVPPPELAFAVQSAYALREQKKQERRLRQQLQQQQQQQHRGLRRKHTSSCFVSTERRVRARVWC